MGSSSLGKWVGAWVKRHYPEAYRDLCTSFIDRGFALSAANGYSAMVTMQSWMFLGSFEKLRGKILRNRSISSMAHLGTRAFGAIAGEVVSTTATVFANAKSEVKGAYFRLVDMGSEAEKQAGLLEALADPDCGWFYRADADGFGAIPGSPIAYWCNRELYKAFLEGNPLRDITAPKKGLGTGNKDLFMRLWWETSLTSICFNASNRKDALASNCRWFPHNKGGEYRKWYGNCDYVVDWLDDGAAIKSYTNEQGQLAARPQNTDCYFKECITWSKISSGKLAFRFKNEGDIFNEVAPALFGERTLLVKLEAFLNSSVCDAVASILSPTLDFQVGQVACYPILESVLENADASDLVEYNTKLSHRDWDSFEESWGFRKHPLA